MRKLKLRSLYSSIIHTQAVPNDRDPGLNPSDLPSVNDEHDTVPAIGDYHDDSATAAGSGLAEDSEKKALLVKPNAQMNNNVLVAFLQALLSLFLFNFNNNRNNASGSDRIVMQTTTVGDEDDDDDADAVEETQVAILQTGEDEFEIEEIPTIRTED